MMLTFTQLLDQYLAWKNRVELAHNGSREREVALQGFAKAEGDLNAYVASLALAKVNNKGNNR